MTIEEIKRIYKSTDPKPYVLNSVAKKWKQIAINNKIAIPVEKCASSFKTDSELSVYDINGNEIGRLCFTRELGEITWGDLTENQFIAFLNEADYSKKGGEIYKFTKNYLVINEGFYNEYLKNYQLTAPLWGSFYHPTPDILTSTKQGDISEIRIRNLKVPPKIFLETAIRAIAQPFAFERFLKLYHLLELRFDFEVISQIKELDVELESEKIGELLSEYNRNEIHRLEDILAKYCTDINAIVDKLNGASRFQSESCDLFFKFSSSKEGNPFNKQENQFKEAIGLGFDEINLKSSKVNFQKKHKEFIIKLVAYWIYRIRCSIAHNKIGEYLLSMDKEEYIVKFAEPLLKEVLLQCFKK